MLEYLSYKKYKKGSTSRAAAEEEKRKKQKQRSKPLQSNDTAAVEATGPAKTILKPEDQGFFEDLCADDGGGGGGDDDGPAPPLPPRIYAWDMDSASETEGVSGTESGGQGTRESSPKPQQNHPSPTRAQSVKQGSKKPSRLSVLFARTRTQGDADEASREQTDASRVLSRLNLFVKNNTVLSYSSDASDLLERFTEVFKDLVRGVPSAMDDLTRLIKDRDGAIAATFDKMPAWMQRLVTQLPDMLTASLGPELLTAAAASQGLKVAAGAGAGVGVKDTAKSFLKPCHLGELLRKPGAAVGMFKAIVNILKTRWPAFIGMNVIWSVALILLLVVLWYCYKRGRDERDHEKKPNSPRFEELPSGDLPAITTSEPSSSSSQRVS